MSSNDTFVERVNAQFSPTATGKSYANDQWPLHQGTADGVIATLEAKPPAKLLDLACGTGASTAALALKGFDVTGLDCTTASICIARQMSRERGAAVDWLCQDMRLIGYREEFDYVCLRDVIFGILETDEEHLDLLRRMAMALKPGGKCLLEVYNREFALVHGIEGELFYDQFSGRFLAQRRRHGLDAGMRLYSHEEWRSMLEGQGLRIVKLGGYWNWPKDPPPPPWRADVIVAQKPVA